MRLLLAAIIFLTGVVSAAAERRVGLVIGNSRYESVSLLPNAAGDADSVAAMLRSIGFEVRTERDLGFDAFRRALRDFSVTASGADIAVVFYAGHGIEIDRANYLIPTDAKLASDRDVQYEAVPLDLVLNAVEGARGLRLVMLDACRDNPFKAMRLTKATRSIGRGLASIEPAFGTLVAFSAKEGTTAADGDAGSSPFAQALLALAPEPGLEVNFLFRRVRDRVLAATGGAQEPFVYGSLPGREIFLVPPKPAAAPPVEAAVRPAAPTEPAAEPAPPSELAFARGVVAEERRAFGEAAAAFTRAAEAGNAAAMVRLAMLHARAPRLVDEKAARGWLERAAEAGEAEGAFQLGKLLEGSGKAAELPLAAAAYRKAAQAGHVDAMNNVATLLASGNGLPRDEREAVTWYRRAVEQNSALAMFNLAAMLDDGRAVRKDAREAAELILRALRLRNAAVYEAVAGNHKAWSREFGIELQKALAREGLYRGRTDGAFGQATLAAMKAAMK